MTKDEYLDNLFELAKKADKENRESAVIELLQAYLKHQPENSLGWLIYGDALRVVGRYAEAEVALLKSLEISPRNKRQIIQVSLAMNQSGQGNHEKAEKWFYKACQSKAAQNLGFLWALRGANLMHTGKFKTAEKYYRKAITMKDVDLDEVYLNLGYTLRAQGRYSEAQKATSKALKINPNYKDAKDVFNSLQGIQKAMDMAKNIPKK